MTIYEKPVPPALITRPMNTASGHEPPLWVLVLAALVVALILGGLYLAGVR